MPSHDSTGNAPNPGASISAPDEIKAGLVVLWMKNLSSQGGSGGETRGSGSVTLLKVVDEPDRAIMAFWIQKRRKMKNKEEKSCRNVAAFFRHESHRFFFSSALNCWNSSGNPLCKSMRFFVCVCGISLFDWSEFCNF